MRESFTAGTQYNDFVGTAAADISDNVAFKDHLVTQGLMTADEHVVGFEIVFNENHGVAIPEPGIVAYILPQGVNGPAPSRIRAVEVFNLPIADFFAFFKRFNVVAMRKGLHLSDTTIEYPPEP